MLLFGVPLHMAIPASVNDSMWFCVPTAVSVLFYVPRVCSVTTCQVRINTPVSMHAGSVEPPIAAQIAVVEQIL